MAACKDVVNVDRLRVPGLWLGAAISRAVAVAVRYGHGSWALANTAILKAGAAGSWGALSH